MRWIGLLGLLLVRVIAMVSARQSLNVRGPAAGASAPVTEQSRQIQQQYKQALDAALQTPRDVPDDAR